MLSLFGVLQSQSFTNSESRRLLYHQRLGEGVDCAREDELQPRLCVQEATTIQVQLRGRDSLVHIEWLSSYEYHVCANVDQDWQGIYLLSSTPYLYFNLPLSQLIEN